MARRDSENEKNGPHLFTEPFYIGFAELLALPKLRDPAVNLLGVHGSARARSKSVLNESSVIYRLANKIAKGSGSAKDIVE